MIHVADERINFDGDFPKDIGNKDYGICPQDNSVNIKPMTKRIPS